MTKNYRGHHVLVSVWNCRGKCSSVKQENKWGEALSVMLHIEKIPIFCLHDVTLGQGAETDWPALWGAVSSGRIPKDSQWPQPAPTWWGAHSVCKRSSPSPTLRPKPRPSWVSCPASYQQPINVPKPKLKIQLWWWKHNQQRKNSRTGWDVKYPILCDVLKHHQAQHPSRPLTVAICTKLRRSSHFPGIPSHPAPPISRSVWAAPPPGGWNSWQPCPWGLTFPILLVRYCIKQVWGWIKDTWTIWWRLAEQVDLTEQCLKNYKTACDG